MTDTALSPVEIVRLLHATTNDLVAEVWALGSRATIRPAEGEWCANEVLGHLIEADRRGFAGRIRTVLAEDRPTFVKWDQPGVAQERRDNERDPNELVQEFLAARETDLAFMAQIDPALLGRVGIHPSVGELSVNDLLHEWVHHDREHLIQMLAVSQVLVRPFMGNARKFSDPTA
jgi:hypothetical protein